MAPSSLGVAPAKAGSRFTGAHGDDWIAAFAPTTSFIQALRFQRPESIGCVFSQAPRRRQRVLAKRGRMTGSAPPRPATSA